MVQLGLEMDRSKLSLELGINVSVYPVCAGGYTSRSDLLVLKLDFQKQFFDPHNRPILTES